MVLSNSELESLGISKMLSNGLRLDLSLRKIISDSFVEDGLEKNSK